MATRLLFVERSSADAHAAAAPHSGALQLPTLGTHGARVRMPQYDYLFVDSFPDLDRMSDGNLRDFLARLVADERDLATKQSGASYSGRILHGKIDVVRAELARRRRRRED